MKALPHSLTAGGIVALACTVLTACHAWTGMNCGLTVEPRDGAARALWYVIDPTDLVGFELTVSSSGAESVTVDLPVEVTRVRIRPLPNGTSVVIELWFLFSDGERLGPYSSSVTPTYNYRTGAMCNDGTTSTATGSGACSHHGGVSYWLSEYPEDEDLGEWAVLDMTTGQLFTPLAELE